MTPLDRFTRLRPFSTRDGNIKQYLASAANKLKHMLVHHWTCSGHDAWLKYVATHDTGYLSNRGHINWSTASILKFQSNSNGGGATWATSRIILNLAFSWILLLRVTVKETRSHVWTIQLVKRWCFSIWASSATVKHEFLLSNASSFCESETPILNEYI